MADQRLHRGRLLKAPENFLSNEQIAEVAAGRRDFLRKAFLAGGGLTAAALMGKTLAADGDSAILNLPSWSKTLGKPVASTGYGTPSQYEHNLQRRESPGLTRVSASSVSFAPLTGPVWHHHTIRSPLRATPPGLAGYRSQRYRRQWCGAFQRQLWPPAETW